MHVSSFQKLSRAKKVGALLVGTTLVWSVGLPAFVGTASAANLLNVSDTIVNSAPGASTNHTIVYTSSSAVTGGQTIRLTFSPGNTGGAADEFLFDSFATSTDITVSGSVGITEVANGGACGGGTDEVYNVANFNNPGQRYVELMVCPGDTVAAQTLTISLINNHVTNPTTVNSYVVRIGGTQADSADTRVAIINNVTMTARVDTSLTFTISGLATSTAVNGTSTSLTTTATAIPFNTVAPGVIYTAGQRLNVTTNAANGFQVTVVQNQNLTSNNGADIDLFIDGAETAVPVAWQSPANTLGNELTYGHYGVTSEDSTLVGPADPFGSALFAGNFDAGSPLQVFWHDDPSDGTTANIGETDVAFQLQIGSLQEAANDYNNTLTYVATPIF